MTPRLRFHKLSLRPGRTNFGASSATATRVFLGALSPPLRSQHRGGLLFRAVLPCMPEMNQHSPSLWLTGEQEQNVIGHESRGLRERWHRCDSSDGRGRPPSRSNGCALVPDLYCSGYNLRQPLQGTRISRVPAENRAAVHRRVYAATR